MESTLRNCCSFLHHLKVPVMLITVEMVVTLPFKAFLYAKLRLKTRILVLLPSVNHAGLDVRLKHKKPLKNKRSLRGNHQLPVQFLSLITSICVRETLYLWTYKEIHVNGSLHRMRLQILFCPLGKVDMDKQSLDILFGKIKVAVQNRIHCKLRSAY